MTSKAVVIHPQPEIKLIFEISEDEPSGVFLDLLQLRDLGLKELFLNRDNLREIREFIISVLNNENV